MSAVPVTALETAPVTPAVAMRLSPQEHERLRRQHAQRRALTAYLFLLPNAIFFIAFLLIPVVFMF